MASASLCRLLARRLPSALPHIPHPRLYTSAPSPLRLPFQPGGALHVTIGHEVGALAIRVADPLEWDHVKVESPEMWRSHYDAKRNALHLWTATVRAKTATAPRQNPLLLCFLF
mmetsp:Transcript_15644/g.40107  ORF Transcript_15644/g.40107 Transcript_15644/m.40107 type:complete len:114 (+) Transcript_15644:3-344(+)